jgi:hypothetical protein
LKRKQELNKKNSFGSEWCLKGKSEEKEPTTPILQLSSTFVVLLLQKEISKISENKQNCTHAGARKDSGQ